MLLHVLKINNEYNSFYLNFFLIILILFIWNLQLIFVIFLKFWVYSNYSIWNDFMNSSIKFIWRNYFQQNTQLKKLKLIMVFKIFLKICCCLGNFKKNLVSPFLPKTPDNNLIIDKTVLIILDSKRIEIVQDRRTERKFYDGMKMSIISKLSRTSWSKELENRTIEKMNFWKLANFHLHLKN